MSIRNVSSILATTHIYSSSYHVDLDLPNLPSDQTVPEKLE